ncbi:dynamin family protein [Alteribacter populi]|uniref:dynamin family protein n=1 Tax=Alteribacter populi TaxID=2011011 RepID=UPI000BBAA368|nr:dynamin family protein [Alteribacter populi]
MTTIVKDLNKENVDIPLTIEEKFRFQKLTNKFASSTFEVAFCGHFSAGKSTLLNRLVGAEILPTSPIPTSANIIGIENGELGLTVHAKGEEDQLWSGEIPWSKVREWGMNGHDISGLTINAPFPFLGNSSRILDTPGVDSTDDAHEAVTVEQLYTTDAIVYVMDYNHVQSETNLYFLKQCSLEKKPIFLVINQIDKHNETEIPISLFKESVNEVLAKWEINIIDLYFTTMKQLDHPLNEFDRFEKAIKSLLFQGHELRELFKERLENGFYQAVKKRLGEEKYEAIEDVSNEMNEHGYQIRQLEEKQHLEQELIRLDQIEKVLTQQFNDQFKRVFKNVTLFPYTTTELAKRWIESMKSGFKVGVLFTKKKTKAEQSERLSRLEQELEDKVKTLILYKVKAYFQGLDRTKLTNTEAFEHALSALKTPPLHSLLINNVKVNHTDRNYVRTFTQEITQIIVRDIQRQANELIALYAEGMADDAQEQSKNIKDQLEELKAISSYQERIDELKRSYDENLHKVGKLLEQFPPDDQHKKTLFTMMKKSYPQDEGSGVSKIELPKESVISTEEEEIDNFRNVDFSEENTLAWLSDVKSTLRIFEGQSVLSEERNQLLKRIARYENQTYVISLFGAFSAGKSSFANALLGDDVLPVSPNPTTATVNTVQKSTSHQPHGTVDVIIKKAESLSEEIDAVSKELNEKVTLETLSDWKPNKKGYVTSTQKTYAEYLLTLRDSLAETDWELGTSFKVTLNNLQDIVAKEQNSCLVEKVHIYYDSPITKNGIVLVDTPGVNSIHGRHTNVAFQQMRQSDAIFYLTYYNHAFSKADQYFLQQIGKVNESFTHDKLYFVINAADLAGSEGELHGVRKHVKDQLVVNGIESPRLYHLSSKEGLKAKKANVEESNSFTNFEEAFYSKTILELKKLSAETISLQLSQYANKIEHSLSFVNAKEDEQKEQHIRLMETVEQQTDRVKKASFDYVQQDVVDEFEQLTIYLRERMRFVLNDYFTSAINVTVLTGNSKRQLHEQFSGAVKEWIAFGEQFMRQEVEATLIRMEERIKRRIKNWLKDEEARIQKELPYLSCECDIVLGELKINIREYIIDIDAADYSDFIKSKKDFFENGRVKEVKDALVKEGALKASDLLQQMTPEFETVIQTTVSKLEETVKTQLVNSIKRELTRFEALFDPVLKNEIQKEYKQVNKHID